MSVVFGALADVRRDRCDLLVFEHDEEYVGGNFLRRRHVYVDQHTPALQFDRHLETIVGERLCAAR